LFYFFKELLKKCSKIKNQIKIPKNKLEEFVPFGAPAFVKN